MAHRFALSPPKHRADTEVCRSLEKLLEEGGSLQHIETGTIALDLPRELPESEFPHIIVIPSQMPILWGADFVAELRAGPRLRAIPVFVWGANTRSDEIENLYKAGVTSAFLVTSTAAPGGAAPVLSQ